MVFTHPWIVLEISLVRWTHLFYFRHYYLVLKYQTGRLSPEVSYKYHRYYDSIRRLMR